MKTHDIDEKLISNDGTEFRIRCAEEKDMDDIKQLYFKAYGGTYSLPEVTNSDKMKWALNDPNFLWLLIEKDGKVIGAVLFVVDKTQRLGKSLAGVVLPEYRGHKLMKKALKRGLDYILQDKNFVDEVYGVVRTFVPQSFHDDLQSLGFIDVGIFPNVRKLSKYETHGLKVLFKDGSLALRKEMPRLIQAADDIYQIVRSRLKLEQARICDYRYVTTTKFKKYDFCIEKSPEIEWEYYKERDAGNLIMSFFPFHYPQIKLYTKDKKTRAYINFEERDGHADLMGLATDNPENLADILQSIAEHLEPIGVKYLEVLINAFEPDFQKMAYEADFLPCAYFPGLQKDSDGKRTDFIVCSRIFVPLDLRGVKLTDATRAYIRAYYRIWTTKMWEDLEHA